MKHSKHGNSHWGRLVVAGTVAVLFTAAPITAYATDTMPGVTAEPNETPTPMSRQPNATNGMNVQTPQSTQLNNSGNDSGTSSQQPSTQDDSGSQTAVPSTQSAQPFTRSDGSIVVPQEDPDGNQDGCQVYYPAGAKINLATAAKDSDCWDSSQISKNNAHGDPEQFLGWSENQHPDVNNQTDEDNSGIVKTITMPAGPKTVYAVWANRLVLTYNTNSPTGQQPANAPAPEGFDYGGAPTDNSHWKRDDDANLPGYAFLGWYDSPTDATPHNWANTYKQNVTVWAHWAHSTIKYDANGGTGSVADVGGVPGRTTTADDGSNFNWDHHRFKGWNTKKDGTGTLYKKGVDPVPFPDNGDTTTLYAQWEVVFDHATGMPRTGTWVALAIIGVSVLLLGAGGWYAWNMWKKRNIQ